MRHFFLLSVFILICSYATAQDHFIPADSIIKAEFHLSAFGVESDDYPSIDVYIDFQKDSSYCHKWYYNPAYKDSSYTLSHDEIQKVKELLLKSDSLYIPENPIHASASDQPSVTSKVYWDHTICSLYDYGLDGAEPLPSVYRLVFKF
ncbi:MAG TPA: hypothetical protein VL651_12905 [Bacteroidia bacterium]|jgi:hypothetical protein|nr:hypothetical protein [Bacteroidia bacterium]